MEVIVNADDLGYSARRDAGILSAFRDGMISSASLMVTGDSALQSAKSAQQLSLPVGLHLNLSEGRPLTAAPSLVDSAGQLFYKMKFWNLHKSPTVLRDVAAETIAQLETFKQWFGHYPDRVDGHQHVHVARHIPETIAPILREKGVTYVRIPDQDPDNLPWLDATTRRRYERRYVPAVAARLVYSRHGFKSPLCFTGLGISGRDMTLDRIDQCLQHCYGSVELMVHPGFLTPKPASCDAFDADPGRLREYHVLKSVKDKYTLVDWTKVI